MLYQIPVVSITRKVWDLRPSNEEYPGPDLSEKTVIALPSLRTDHKTTPKRAWPRSHDLTSKFWDPLIIFEPIELST